MLLGEVIKEYRITNSLSLRAFANKCGLSYTYISMLEKNQDYRTGKPIAPTLDSVKYIANGMGMSIEELLKILDDEQEFKLIEDTPKHTSNPAVVLVYGTIPAGIPMEMIEDIIDTEEIDANMLKGGKEYFGLKIKGDSMNPDYLDGDVIILQKQDDCENGEDCVVMVNGNEGTFKRVFKNPETKTITLQPLNMQRDEYGKLLYEPTTYTEELIEQLPVRILGVFEELRRKKKKK